MVPHFSALAMKTVLLVTGPAMAMAATLGYSSAGTPTRKVSNALRKVA